MLCDFHILKRRVLIVEELYYDPAKVFVLLYQPPPVPRCAVLMANQSLREVMRT
jgi:hypothetical protein